MQWLPRTPAHLELRPIAPIWCGVNHELSLKLLQWTGLNGDVVRMQSSVPVPYGYYKINAKNGEEYFIKILSTVTDKQQNASDRMAVWLKKLRVETSCIIEGFPRYVPKKDYLVLAYNNINAHFARPLAKELASIGEALGYMHSVMKECKWATLIENSGYERHEILVSRFNDFTNGNKVIAGPSAVNDILANVETDLLSVLVDGPQVVHGDLNYGNILIRESDSQIVFLDFEDSWSAWFTPLFDVAFVIERFAMVDSDEESFNLSVAFIESYFSKTGIGFTYENQLGDLLRAMSVRSLLLLSLCSEDDPSKVNINEWNKFIDLYTQAESRSLLLKSIVNAD